MTPMPQQPPLEELLSRFLARQAEDRSAGIAEAEATEVQPYEAAFAPLVEPRTAWEEATAAVKMLNAANSAWKAAPPAQWTALAMAPEGTLAVAFAAGNYPQLVKDLPLLVREKQRSKLRSVARPEFPAPNLQPYLTEAIRKGDIPQALLGVGVVRLARHLEAASDGLTRIRAAASKEWHVAIANEEATLLWDQDKAEEALKIWSALPDSAPVCFNRGMALLFLDRAKEAKPHLQKAVESIPDDNAWHHLARLYLTLTEI